MESEPEGGWRREVADGAESHRRSRVRAGFASAGRGGLLLCAGLAGTVLAPGLDLWWHYLWLTACVLLLWVGVVDLVRASVLLQSAGDLVSATGKALGLTGTERDSPAGSRVVVGVDDSGVRLWIAGRKAGELAWSELRRVSILTRAPDLWADDLPAWLLEGIEQEKACIVPHLAQGEEALGIRLRNLEGFDRDAAFRAACATEDGVVLCWTRPPGEDPRSHPP